MTRFIGHSRHNTGLEEAVLAGGGENVWWECYQGISMHIAVKDIRYHSAKVIMVDCGNKK
jgi:hypothetical protein